MTVSIEINFFALAVHARRGGGNGFCPGTRSGSHERQRGRYSRTVRTTWRVVTAIPNPSSSSFVSSSVSSRVSIKTCVADDASLAMDLARAFDLKHNARIARIPSPCASSIFCIVSFTRTFSKERLAIAGAHVFDARSHSRRFAKSTRETSSAPPRETKSIRISAASRTFTAACAARALS